MAATTETKNGGASLVPKNDELVFEIARDKKALEKAYDILRGSSHLGVDSETGGFVPQKVPLWSVQLSNYEYSVLVPWNYLKTLGPLQELLLDSKIIKIFHNGKFDLKFFKHNGIEVHQESIVDTMINEKLLKAGVEFVHGHGMSLKGLADKYLDYQMSKEERTVFYDGTFYRKSKRNPRTVWTPDLIDYTLDDVWVLKPIFLRQMELLDSMGMGRVQEIESRLVPVVARMEYLGVAADAAKMEVFGDKMQSRADVLWEDLRNTLEPLWQQYWRPEYAEEQRLWLKWEAPYKRIKTKASKKYAEQEWKRHPNLLKTWERMIGKAEGKERRSEYRESRDKHKAEFIQKHLAEYQPKLLELREQKPFQSPPKERGEISITSNQQLQAALGQAGLHLPNMQKVTMEDAAGENEVLDLLLDFRKYEKLAKYRTVILENLNDVTNRVHPDINQIVSTGRFSISNPPLQQIPAKTDEGKELRSCFIAPVGRRLVSADYSAIELVIIGALSGDKALLEAIDRQEEKGFDLHAWTMSKFLEVPYESLIALKQGIDSDEVQAGRQEFEAEVQIPDLSQQGWDEAGMQAWFNKLRDVVKTLTYGIAYGLSEFGLSRKFHMSKESAAKIISLFYYAYPGVETFIDERGKRGLSLGYSSTPIGRRRFYLVPPTPDINKAKKALKEEIEEEGRAWEDLPTIEREQLTSKKLQQLRREREWIISAIKRKAANMPIQGASADMTKIAMVLYEERTRHFPYEDFLRLTVHDELVAEVGVERAEEAARILETSMTDAAYEFLPESIPVKAEAKINTHWSKGD